MKQWCYHLINACLAGGLVLLGSFVSGTINWESFGFASIAAAVVILTKFKEYWDGAESDLTTKIFNFI